MPGNSDGLHTARPDDAWSWAPLAPLHTGPDFDLGAPGTWAPASTVQRPLLRVGGLTLLYRRAAAGPARRARWRPRRGRGLRGAPLQ